MSFENKFFKKVRKVSTTKGNFGYMDDISFAFNFLKGEDSLIPHIFTGLVSQKFDGTYNRNFRYITYTSHTFLKMRLTSIDIKANYTVMEKIKGIHPDFNSTATKLENISNSYEMIAVLVSERLDNYVLFRFNSSIKYCPLDEVNTHFDQNYNSKLTGVLDKL